MDDLRVSIWFTVTDSVSSVTTKGWARVNARQHTANCFDQVWQLKTWTSQQLAAILASFPILQTASWHFLLVWPELCKIPNLQLVGLPLPVRTVHSAVSRGSIPTYGILPCFYYSWIMFRWRQRHWTGIFSSNRFQLWLFFLVFFDQESKKETGQRTMGRNTWNFFASHETLLSIQGYSSFLRSGKDNNLVATHLQHMKHFLASLCDMRRDLRHSGG